MKEPPAPASTRWHAQSAREVLRLLGAEPGGLSVAEAQDRHRRFGPNTLPKAALPSRFRIFLRQFKNPLVYLLFAATLASLAVGEWLDATFIFVVLLFNAAIGGVQEYHAQKRADELTRLVPQRATVRREQGWVELDSALLVPGDIVRLESGARVSADLRLLDNVELQIDESLLTGESMPVYKDASATVPSDAPLAERRTMLFAGTVVLSGRATAVVADSGAATEIGRIALSLSAGDPQQPPLIRKLANFSRIVGIATIVLIGLIATAEALQGTPLVSVFLVAVALAVAAIPEGLPVAITVALAIATNRMQRRKVIVRSLPAVEGLGACTLIASDKTGTLTHNELTVKRCWLPAESSDKATAAGVTAQIGGQGYDTEGAVEIDTGPPDTTQLAHLRRLAVSAALCNEATLDVAGEPVGDTVDIAFLVFALKLGLDPAALQRQSPVVSTIPYEPERRFAAAFVSGGVPEPDSLEAHVKGAAEVVLPMCGGLAESALATEVEHLAGAGFRVIAVARGRVAEIPTEAPTAACLSGLELLGLVGLIDPIRPEVPEAISRCRAAGISVRMITGDHPATALAIARDLGLAAGAADVAGESEIRLMASRPEAFGRLVAGKTVFARVEPAQKLAIVQALQRRGEVVAVTGDGVNDAPALNAADIGVAMGRSGTDVARSAADLVIADDNFASIVAGVEEGRIAYDNVRKLIFLLISTGLGEIVLFVLTTLWGLPIPLFAVQLLWLNLVTNGIQDVALAFEKGEAGINERPPRPPNQPLFDRRMTLQVCFSGLYMGVVAAVAYGWMLQRGVPLDEARNLLLLLMVLFENVHAMNVRSERRSALKVPLSANWFLIIAIIGAQLLHIAALFTPGLSNVLGAAPIALLDWLLVAALAGSLMLALDVFKLIFGHYFPDR